MLEGYQLEDKVKTVRTCRYCAGAGRYSPITTETAVKDDNDWICTDCAKQELERQLSFSGGGEVSGAAKERLEELMMEVQDLERIVNLLKGQLDPDLTKFDTISATTEEVDPVRTDSLNLHPGIQDLLEDRFETLLPVQSLAVENSLLDGEDQLVVSATATGKTLVGEMTGIDRVLEGKGTMLFLVPLVALANQKYEDFQDEYGHLVDVSIRVGASRIADNGNQFDPNADVIVGTYGDRPRPADGQGDGRHRDRRHRRGPHAERGGSRPPAGRPHLAAQIHVRAAGGAPRRVRRRTVGLPLGDRRQPEAAHRSARGHAHRVRGAADPDRTPRHLCGRPGESAGREQARQTRVRHRVLEGVSRADDHLHQLPAALSRDFAEAGLLGRSLPRRTGLQAPKDGRTQVRRAGALGGRHDRRAGRGVDFPASQVIFDSLAMGIEWLSVQEFHQMLGRAGRPDYHDTGTVYVLVEPDTVYHNSMEMSEDEVAFKLLKGEMESVMTHYDEAAAVEETLANVTVGGKAAKALNDRMLGDVPTKHAIGKLLQYDFIDGFEPTPLGRVVTEHFLEPGQAFTLLDGIRKDAHPYELVADIELRDEDL